MRCSAYVEHRESRINNFCEAFNHYWEHRVDTNDLSDKTSKGIRRNRPHTALFRPLSGILRQRTDIPLRYMPLTIQLYIVDRAADPHPLVGNDGKLVNANNCSSTWAILNAQVHAILSLWTVVCIIHM